MRKGLIGIMVLACVALISGSALGAPFWSVDVEGTVEWTIVDQTGLMPGVDGTGPALVIPELIITAGPWEAGTGAGTTAPGGDVDVASGSGYIKYTADMGSIALNNEVSYDIFGLGADIAAAQGITLATEVAPLSLEVVYTAGSEYGIGLEYAAGEVSTLGLAYNSTAAWGVQLVTGISALDVTITTAMKDSDSAYGIALAAGSISLGYDVTFDSVTVAAEDKTYYVGMWTGIWYEDPPGDEPSQEVLIVDDTVEVAGPSVSKLSAVLTDLPLTENTLLTVEAVSQDITDVNYEAGTTITATAVTALDGAIDLTTVIASIPVTGIEYSAKIGVSF